MLNRQGRAITGKYRRTPIGGHYLSESGLTQAKIMLDYRPRKYAC